MQAFLDWSEEAFSDVWQDLMLDRLRTLLLALVTAFVGAHTYSRTDPGEDGDLHVDVHDQRCGTIVEAVW